MRRHLLSATVAGALAVVGTGLGGCGTSGSATGPVVSTPLETPVTVAPIDPAPIAAPTTAPPTTTPPTAPPPTAYAPTTPEASAQDAVERLVATWDNHDRGSAGQVATAAVVATLFAISPRPLQFRNCSDGLAPITCSYADRSAGGNFYELSAMATAGGNWYVDQAQITPIG